MIYVLHSNKISEPRNLSCSLIKKKSLNLSQAAFEPDLHLFLLNLF